MKVSRETISAPSQSFHSSGETNINKYTKDIILSRDKDYEE